MEWDSVLRGWAAYLEVLNLAEEARGFDDGDLFRDQGARRVVVGDLFVLGEGLEELHLLQGLLPDQHTSRGAWGETAGQVSVGWRMRY